MSHNDWTRLLYFAAAVCEVLGVLVIYVQYRREHPEPSVIEPRPSIGWIGPLLLIVGIGIGLCANLRAL
jgi:hypothetical protein